jgi:hypothetical protein
MCIIADDIYEKTILSLGSTESIELSASDILLNNSNYEYNGDFTFDKNKVKIIPNDINAIVDYYQINNKLQIPSVKYNSNLSEVELTFNHEVKGKFLLKYDSILIEQSISAST